MKLYLTTITSLLEYTIYIKDRIAVHTALHEVCHLQIIFVFHLIQLHEYVLFLDLQSSAFWNRFHCQKLSFIFIFLAQPLFIRKYLNCTFLFLFISILILIWRESCALNLPFFILIY